MQSPPPWFLAHVLQAPGQLPLLPWQDLEAPWKSLSKLSCLPKTHLPQSQIQTSVPGSCPRVSRQQTRMWEGEEPACRRMRSPRSVPLGAPLTPRPPGLSDQGWSGVSARCHAQVMSLPLPRFLRSPHAPLRLPHLPLHPLPALFQARGELPLPEALRGLAQGRSARLLPGEHPARHRWEACPEPRSQERPRRPQLLQFPELQAPHLPLPQPFRLSSQRLPSSSRLGWLPSLAAQADRHWPVRQVPARPPLLRPQRRGHQLSVPHQAQALWEFFFQLHLPPLLQLALARGCPLLPHAALYPLPLCLGCRSLRSPLLIFHQ
mmetsp:Transcript_101132/g.179521  ORF Transcript_101132/g.179521 Transcript_101132/m.179521 type:complete len:320 (-) Transcript_101132:331-1290(-)